jgi:hypothetical protein
VAPWLTFDEVAARLAALGWRGGADVAYAPLVPGEPEVATWTLGRATLAYTCNPAVWLRLVEATGVDDASWGAVARALPHLDERGIAGLLQSADDEEVVLALLAVEALGVRSAAAEVAALAGHPRALVADLAASVARSLRS